MPVLATTPEGSSASCVAERARILAVYPESGSADVATLSTARVLYNINIAFMTADSTAEIGARYLPVPGSICYVWTPSDGSTPFIMGFIRIPSVSEENDVDLTYTSNPGEMNPGDIVLKASRRNFVKLLGNGILQIGGSQLAQTVYIPLDNLIRDYFVKYQAVTPLGDIVWEHAEIELDDQDVGTTDVVYKFNCKDHLQQTKASVQIRMGGLSEKTLDGAVDSSLLKAGESTNIEVLGDNLSIDGVELPAGSGDRDHLFAAARKRTGLGLDSGDGVEGRISVVVASTSGSPELVAQVSAGGDLFVRSSGHVHIEADESMFMHVGKLGVTTSGGAELRMEDFIRAKVSSAVLELFSGGGVHLAGTSIEIDGSGQVIISSKGGVTLTGSVITMNAPVIQLGGSGAATDIVVNSKDLMTLLATHIHPAVGAPPSPPLQLPLPTTTSSLGTATKVLVK